MNERLKLLRNTIKLTQHEFARRIGAAQSTVTNYEMGRRELSNTVVTSICREFRVREEWLRTGQGDMFLPEDSVEAIIEGHPTLTPECAALIRTLAELPEHDQSVIVNYLMKACASIEKIKPSERSAGMTPDELRVELDNPNVQNEQAGRRMGSGRGNRSHCQQDRVRVWRE